MNRTIREILGLHTRFETGESFFSQYATAIQDKYALSGVTKLHTITLTETHRKLVRQAQKQNLLHKDIGYVRAIRLTDAVYYYDVGFRSIDGKVFSRGTSLNLDEAVARAFGELYERVPMRFVPLGETVVKKSYKQLQSEHASVLNIFDLASATQKQKELFPEMSWDENSIFGWVTAENLFTGEPILVPAQLLYWNYRRIKGEPLLGEINSNGLGAGYTFDEAVVSATCELVQRHSFFTYWYAKKAPPKISVQSFLDSTESSDDAKKLISAVREYGFTVHLLDCTLEDGTPSVATVLTKVGLGWFVGMSTNIVYEKAIERGVCEALSIYTWVMDNADDRRQANVLNKHCFSEGFCDSGISSDVRVRAWSQEAIAKGGLFFLSGSEVSFCELTTQKFISGTEMLSGITEGQVFVKRAVQPYLNEIEFCSVRIIAPKLYKLPLHESLSTPVLNGVNPKNTYPHPFP